MHKYRYLTKYTGHGDIIVLPLEWINYYHKPTFAAYANKTLTRQLLLLPVTALAEKLQQHMLEAGISPAATDYRPGDSIDQLLAEVERLISEQTQGRE